jgi:hypothetical protein
MTTKGYEYIGYSDGGRILSEVFVAIEGIEFLAGEGEESLVIGNGE